MPPYKPLTRKEEAALAVQGQTKKAPAKAAKAAKDKAAKPPTSNFVLPKSLAACADSLYEVREERLTHDRESTVLKKDEAVLRDHLISQLSKGESSGVQGKVAFAYVDTTTAYSVKDWGKFYAAVVKEYLAAKTPGAKEAAFRYLNRAVSKEPMEEIWESGKTFPGVERMTIKKVNVSKKRGK